MELKTEYGGCVPLCENNQGMLDAARLSLFRYINFYILLRQGKRGTNMEINRNGLLLTERVSIEFLKSLTPQFFIEDNYIKFVIDGTNGNVVVGMEIHRDCLDILAQHREYSLNFDESDVWGGNFYFDGTIVWTSTLNNLKNIRLGEWGSSPREISNVGIITRLTEILKKKIIF